MEIFTMMSNVFDFMHIANKSDVINLRSELKVITTHYPIVEMI